jgi:hypothetical protein
MGNNKNARQTFGESKRAAAKHLLRSLLSVKA